MVVAIRIERIQSVCRTDILTFKLCDEKRMQRCWLPSRNLYEGFPSELIRLLGPTRIDWARLGETTL